MERLQRIDAKIQEGYARISKGDYPSGCDMWLEAWEGIKCLFTEGVAEDIHELDDKYDWTEFVSNYAQDLEIELRNAGLEDKSYHHKRIVYCKELLQWCGSDELIAENTRRGMAESYFLAGDAATGEQYYLEWLRDDPDWGWGYIGWSDYYQFGSNKQFEKAEEILQTGFARDGLRDRIYVAERLASLYEDMGKLDKAKEYKEKYTMLERAESSHYSKPSPVKVVKIGRNEPCPCGSGKKYKKCCGA